jgi:26S proteasome regulatory subunit T5
MVANVGEILEPEAEENVDHDGSGFSVKKSGNKEVEVKQKSLVIKTTGRHTVYLPVPGLVESEDLKPGELIAVNKESFIVFEKLPAEYDSRVMAMEVDERPTEDYTDIGGLDKQIEELTEAIVLPMTHKERFTNIGIRPPKGLLLHGPPGTGKTLMARACAAQTKATFLKLAGPQLVQMYIGDGAKMIRDAFDLAREKAPSIIFIDELDAIGTKRGSGEGETREVHRTMLELLNQLDGFTQADDIKVIAATNRPDILDPALLRSGRLDRKVELPHPNEEARVRILKIHSKKMNVNLDDVNFEELARSTPDFNGAQVKAVTVEAGMCSLRRSGTQIRHEDFVEGIAQVQAKKKTSLNYYA